MINQQALENAVNLMELEFYRVKRYKVPITVAIVESRCKDLFNKVIEDSIRVSDLYQYLDQNRFLIIFDHTDEKGARLALDKIINHMENKCEESIFMGYSEVKRTDDESSVTIQRAVKALSNAKQRLVSCIEKL